MLSEAQSQQQVFCKRVAIVGECNPSRLHRVDFEESTKQVSALRNIVACLLDLLSDIYNSISGNFPLLQRALEVSFLPSPKVGF